MDRRRFLLGLGAAVGGVMLERAIPLGRVWSFPAKIVVPTNAPVMIAEYADYISVCETFTKQFDGSWRVVTKVGEQILRDEHWGWGRHPVLPHFKLDVAGEPA